MLSHRVTVPSTQTAKTPLSHVFFTSSTFSSPRLNPTNHSHRKSFISPKTLEEMIRGSSSMDPNQQVEAILGPDPVNFESMISLLMSPANDQRSQAESLFNLCYSTHPEALALKLAHLLWSSPHLELRAMSAVILRKLLTRGHDDDGFIWPRLNPTTQASLKSFLLSAVREEEAKTVRKKLCDAVLELAGNLLPENAWPELLPFLFESVRSESPKLQEFALLIFPQLVQYAGEMLEPHLSVLHDIFMTCMTSAAAVPDVRIAALGASVHIIQCLTDSEGRDQFQDLLPAMMTTLTDALNSGQEVTAKEALELLIELAGTEPRFLRKQLVDAVEWMLQIAEADSLEEGTRHLALEFVITLAEAREHVPGMIRTFPQFAGRLFALSMKMLLDVVDDPMWHSAETQEEDPGESISYYVGQECLDRLSIALGGNTIIPVASVLVPAYLAASEWQKHHAALVALSQIAEGCSKVMIKNLEQVVTMVLSSFHDPHPRVRWAAINAIGQLSKDLGPNLQLQYHQLVVPALASALDDFQNPRVQAHAASAILNFTEGCTDDVLAPYLNVIVNKLLVLLQNERKMVVEVALMALASVADSSQEQFQTYYSIVIPYVKAILVNAADKSDRKLCAKALECISLIGISVGKEMFRDDSKQVLEVLMHLQGSQLEADDPIKIYMLQAWARLCKFLGQNFLPYMNVVMPPLLRSAQLKQDVTITSEHSVGEVDDSEDNSIKTTLGDKKIGIDTNVLEEKATACNMLCFYVNELKEGFFPWIDQVAPCLVPLLKFYLHGEIRKAAVYAMPDLLLSAKIAVEKGLAQGCDVSYVKKLSDYIIPGLVEALHKEPDVEICASKLGSLNDCIQISGYLLNTTQVKSIVDELKVVMTASETRKKERRERTNVQDFDDEERDIFTSVGDVLGTLSKIFKASFLPFFDEISTCITLMLGKDKTVEEKRVAICIFNDVAEQCQEAALKYYHTYLPFLLEACSDENPDVRRAAVYGIGVSAVFGGSVFRPLIGEVLSQLNYVIGNPNGRHPDNVMAYDNAVSALGKVCLFHRDSVNAAQIVPAWLSCLPIRNDLVEAKIVHDQLCSMVERSDGELLGANSQFLPKVVGIFVEIISGGKDLSTEDTTMRMINILRKLRQTLPPAVFASLQSSLQPQQQLALQAILSSVKMLYSQH